MPDRFSVHLPSNPQPVVPYRWRTTLARWLLALLCLIVSGLPLQTIVRAAPAADIAVGCSNLIENGDFEAVNQVWQFSPSTSPPRYSSEVPFSGAQSLRLGVDPGAPMAPSISEVRYYKAIPLPAPAARIILRFRYAPFYEDPLDTDRLEVEVRDANSNQSLLLQSLLGTDRTWLLKEADLLPFAGRALTLYFRVRNNGALGHTWMFLDNVEIEYCSATPLPPTNTPAPTSTPTPTGTLIATSTPTWTPSPTVTPPTWTPVPPPADCNNILLNSSFETDNDWTFGDDPNPSYYSGNQHHEGYRAMLLGHAPEAGADWKSYSSIRQLVMLPSNTITVQLRWWHLYQTQEPPNENPSNVSDRQEVILLSPGQKVLSIVKRVLRNETSWTQDVVDLTPYRGKSLYLYFNVFNDGNSVRTWAYVDEVQLCVNYSPAPALPPSPTPLPLPTASFTSLPTETPTNLPTATETPIPTTVAIINTDTPAAQAAPALEATQPLPTLEPLGAARSEAPATQPLPVPTETMTVAASLAYLEATKTAVALTNTTRLVPPTIISTYVPPRWGVGLGTIAVLFGVAMAIILLASFWVRLSNRERLLIGLLALGFLIWLLLRLYQTPA